MNIKIRKLLCELDKHSRITSKALGKNLRTSQQSVSYLMHSLEKKKIIKKYVTIFDNSRFGLVNFVVLLRCKHLKKEDKSDIIDYLKDEKNVIHIEKLDIMWDFLIIFSTTNISHFNKSLKLFLSRFKDVDRFVILPIIVKYSFCKKYLGFSDNYRILFGDRDVIKLVDKELEICKMLNDNAKVKYLEMAKKIKLDPKTVMKIKKKLEKEGLIKGYTLLVDNKKLGIRRFIILLKLKDYSIEADKKFTEHCRNNKHIVSLYKTLGEWDVILEVELDKKILVEFLEEFRDSNSDLIGDYHSSVSNEIIKSDYLSDGVFE